MRDAFYSSPQLPRLLNPDIIKRAICDGVTQGLLGYATKDSRGNIKLQKLKESLFDTEVEISEDVYILKAEDAQKLLEPPRLARLIVRPEQATIKVGERAEFSVVGAGPVQPGVPDARRRVVGQGRHGHGRGRLHGR